MRVLDGFSIHSEALRHVVLNDHQLERRARLEAAFLSLMKAIETEIPPSSQRVHINRDSIQLFDLCVRSIVFHDDGRMRTKADP